MTEKRTTQLGAPIMASDSDLIKLYSARILSLAADAPEAPRLEAPSASSKKRSPLCGSTVTVDLDVEDGVIVGYGHDVKACALGQASAAVVARSIVGTRPEQVCTAYKELQAMLKDGETVPSAPFEALEALRPAADFKNRHASILLVLTAACDALEQAGAPACA